MPKKSQVLALLELGWRLPPHRSRDRRAARDGQSLRPDAPVKCGQNVPRLRRATPPESPDLPPPRFKCGQNVRRLGVKPGKTFPGSAPRPRFAAAVYRTAITEKLDAGLSLQRIWQDLVEEYGYASYESVKRFVRTSRRRGVPSACSLCAWRRRPVDFFRGAPTLDAATGEWRRPWCFA